MTRCEQKVPYRTRKEALAAMARDARRGFQPKRAYHCRLCRQWHLTSQPVATAGAGAPAHSDRGGQQ